MNKGKQHFEMDRKLSATIFALLICLFANLTTALVPKDDPNSKLLRRSNEMLSFMNEKVDPCENFFEFTCGKFKEIYPSENDEAQESNFFKTTILNVQRQTIDMIKNRNDPKDLDYDKKVKNFFQSCVNLKDGVEPERMMKLLNEIGKMPALEGDKWDSKSFDWQDTLARIIKKYGFPIIINVNVEPDLADKTTNRVYLDKAEFEFESRAIYLQDMGKAYRDSYLAETTDTLVKVLKVDADEAAVIAEKIVALEVELAKGLLDEKADISLNDQLIKTTAEKLQQKYAPTIDVKRFLKDILGEVPEGMLYETPPGYLQNVKKVIEKSDKRDVANYIFYRLVNKFKVPESATPELKETNCIAIVKKRCYKALDNMYYRRYLDEKIEKEIHELWSLLKGTFKVRLTDPRIVDWLTPATRAKALEKLEELKLYINTYKDYDFGKDFNDLKLTEDDYLGNMDAINQLAAKQKFALLHEQNSKSELGEEISITPANVQSENTIYMPVAMLQPYVLWAKNFPDALKFALIGYFLAHELLHTFDDQGRQFDKDGNLNNWWDDESTKQFKERRNCFMNQYHQYIYGPNPLPLSEVQGENIADNSGFKLAYDAFIAHAKKLNEKTSPSMPGLNYSDRQLFFIGFGQFWCSDIQEEVIALQTATDEHTPAKFRNTGVVHNSPDFAEVFNCPAGSKMNPEKKCKMY